jgi:hypothetical protein
MKYKIFQPEGKGIDSRTNFTFLTLRNQVVDLEASMIEIFDLLSTRSCEIPKLKIKEKLLIIEFSIWIYLC